MSKLLAAGLLLAVSQLHANAVSDLVQELSALPATEPVSARVAVTFVQRNASDKTPRKPGTVTVEAEATAAGLRMDFSRATLDATLAESRLTDPEARKPVTEALNEVSAVDVQNYLDAAPGLMRALRGATTLGIESATWKGRPARLLRLKLDPPLTLQQRKYVKQLDATARIWLDTDGVPLAAEQKFDVSGRALLVVSFESSNRQTYEYARRGDRLVVVRHQAEDKSSGGGESGSRTTDARVTVVAATGTSTGASAAP